MKIKYTFFTATTILLLCRCSNSETVVVSPDTFIHENKVYKIIENKPKLIGDLDSDSIKNGIEPTATKRDFKSYDIGYVYSGAYTNLESVLRGNSLYYNLYIYGMNDFKPEYKYGHFTIRFHDKFGFMLCSVEIDTGLLSRNLDMNNKMTGYVYTGHMNMDRQTYEAIDGYTISSNVK